MRSQFRSSADAKPEGRGLLVWAQRRLPGGVPPQGQHACQGVAVPPGKRTTDGPVARDGRPPARCHAMPADHLMSNSWRTAQVSGAAAESPASFHDHMRLHRIRQPRKPWTPCRRFPNRRTGLQQTPRISPNFLVVFASDRCPCVRSICSGYVHLPTGRLECLELAAPVIRKSQAATSAKPGLSGSYRSSKYQARPGTVLRSTRDEHWSPSLRRSPSQIDDGPRH